MLKLMTRGELADAARVLASSFNLINYKGDLYLPVSASTDLPTPPPDPHERVWKVLDRHELQRFASGIMKVLFANESEMVNFELMLKQLSAWEEEGSTSILVRKNGVLALLDEDGNFSEPTGEFVPNYLAVPINDNEDDKKRVFAVIEEWVGGKEEALSLLRHLSTALSPGWSAVKYILLLGEGRNGKSVLLHMVQELFGRSNVSDVSRQQMAEKSPVCADLNGKLLNIVMDGSMDYVKDSGMEKTLIAGETASVRRLYESTLTPVQTNALFLEGLNQEPRTRDKSSALQRRLARYWFPNEYPLNPEFSKQMRTPESLGALLALLIDNYVKQSEAAVMLAPTRKATDLQTDQMVLNSIALQYIQFLISEDPKYRDRMLGEDVKVYIDSFIPWADAQESFTYSDAEALQMFKKVFVLKRSSRRDRYPRNYWRIEDFRPETKFLLRQLLEEKEVNDAVVVDEQRELHSR